MKILNKEIHKFLREIREMNEVGVIFTSLKSRDRLIETLDKSDVLVGSVPIPGRVTYYLVDPKTNLRSIVKPAILIVINEEYSPDEKWAARLSNVASYAIQVK